MVMRRGIAACGMAGPHAARDSRGGDQTERVMPPSIRIFWPVM